MYFAVKEVKPENNYNLLLTFETGEIKYFDTIVWCNSADLDPELLYKKGKLIREQNQNS